MPDPNLSPNSVEWFILDVGNVVDALEIEGPVECPFSTLDWSEAWLSAYVTCLSFSSNIFDWRWQKLGDGSRREY